MPAGSEGAERRRPRPNLPSAQGPTPIQDYPTRGVESRFSLRCLYRTVSRVKCVCVSSSTRLYITPVSDTVQKGLSALTGTAEREIL